MKNRTSVHTKIILILTICIVGITIESVIQKWEFWVPPLLVFGVITLWVIHLSQYGQEIMRENIILLLSFTSAIFHGVHNSCFFEISVANVLLTVALSLLGSEVILNFTLVEYLLVLFVQLVLATYYHTIELDYLNISKVVFHTVVVFSVHYVCRWIMLERKKLMEFIETNDKLMQASLADMDDFLVNISHELRTPVNVVNGISNLILKEEETEDVTAIRDAGLRLSRQIEDIQDYTEIKNGHVYIERDKYMITSLVNDVISNFRLRDDKEKLEIVVDLDPKVPVSMKGDIKKLHKMLRHLIDNAVKFTARGGIYIRISSIKREYGVNLTVEVTDTGKGMTREEVSYVSQGLYQANKERNRSNGGIGLGLSVVYGFAHAMNGFVTINSEVGRGTTVRLCVPQEVDNAANCLSVNPDNVKNVIFHMLPEKYKVTAVRDFYRQMGVNLATGIKVNLYSAYSIDEIKNLMGSIEVSHIFMGDVEYLRNSAFFDNLAASGTVVSVAVTESFHARKNSNLVLIPKPIYGLPVTKVLNGMTTERDLMHDDRQKRPMFDGVRALIVDDEPMNLVVAQGMFRDYGMITETAASGQESIDKFRAKNYDIIFMDHMMPEMDGVEAMKRLKQLGLDKGVNITIVALTANAISGAREMFLREGFDGFIAKPIDIMEFERVMKKLLPSRYVRYVERSAS